MFRTFCAAASIAAFVPALALGQGSARDYQSDPGNVLVEEAMLEGLEFRSLNFSRGGRSTAVAGVRGQPLHYYFGATGGGVWKTTNAGITWTPVGDGHFGVGSIGAIAVAPSDPNVVYVGTGSACPRGNVSNGDGVYRSNDGGATWQHIGLPAAGQIGRIEVHPRNEDLVYVAALGNVFGANEERGVFRSRDGGKTWARVLFLSAQTGVVDLALDPENPRVLYAAAWRAERKPWTFVSGSAESGVYKTSDGGDTWQKLEGGLPGGTVGRVGVAVSPANARRVWALIEAEGDAGGLYRSDDAGKSWKRTSGEAKLRQRPWYYTHVYADPKNADTVYALNTGFYKSIDGGATFPHQIRVPHGDNHDLWLNPDDPANMINANDGGANVSFDGGASWSWQMNQPTAEIYRLVVDEQWPYRVYGSQQDNSTISIPSHGQVAWEREPPDWYAVGGCESGHIAVDPRDPDVVYAGCYGGSISRVDRETGDYREVIGYPQLQLGQAPRDLRYRFQWNAPIAISPHDPDTIYHLSQVVLRSRDQGQSWEAISPDLTTNDREHQDYAGGPITRDSTGVEVFNTLFAFDESPHRRGELWAGSDDGRLHVSRDDGKSWQDTTPKGMPPRGTVNSIDLSRHQPDSLLVAVHRYRENDFRPYLFRSRDGGRSWDQLANGKNGIPATHFVRVAREDPAQRGLLFAGTEFGLYASFDDGEHWQRLQLNLPVSPVTDLRVHRDDLVIATQGRSFWVLDDLAPLRALARAAAGERAAIAKAALHLYPLRAAYRAGGAARVRFFASVLPEQKVELEFARGDQVVRRFEWEPEGSGKKPGPAPAGGADDDFGPPRAALVVKKGMNTFTWNLREEPPKKPEGVVHWGFLPGVAVVPGEYQVRLRSGEWSQTQPLTVLPWPTLAVTPEQHAEQYGVAKQIEERLGRIFDAITDVRSLSQQAAAAALRHTTAGKPDPEIEAAAKTLRERLSTIEGKLTQTRSKSGQDPLNFPPQIDNQYVELYAYVAASEHRPPAGAMDRLRDLEPQLLALLGELDAVIARDVPAFNALVASKAQPALRVPDSGAEGAPP